MPISSMTFNPKEWLRQSLGEDEHSPLKVDPFELKQALRQIRLDLSRQTDPARRTKLVQKYRAATTGDPEFSRLVGTTELKAFDKLLGKPEAALLYEGGGALERNSVLRGEILNYLAGVEQEMTPRFQAQALAEQVPTGEVKIVLAQIEQALAQFDKAMRRLPNAAGGRPVEGTFHKGTAAGMRTTLELTAARLNQPAVAAAIDQLTTISKRPFTYATLADTGVAREDFVALDKAVRAAVKKGAANAAGEIAKLWQAAKGEVGSVVSLHNPKAGFARIEFAGPVRGKGFQAHVAALETFLAKHASFKAGSQRPQR